MLAHNTSESEFEAIDDFHTVRSGKNGGGDPWHTDGRLFLGVIKPDLP